MKKLSFVSACLCALLMLGGCQTSNRSFHNGVAYQDSPINGIMLGHDKKGSVSLGLRRGVAANSDWLKRKLSRTLAGTSSGGILGKAPGTIVALPYPRTETFRLGTVFSKPKTSGFGFVHDDSFASDVQDFIETDYLPSSIFSGFINEISLDLAFQPNKHDELYAKLTAPKPKKVSMLSMSAHVDSARVEILTAGESKEIARRLAKAGVPTDEGYYFIADKVIWAKKISYFIGPGRIKGNPLNRSGSRGIDPTIIENAKANGATVIDVNGVKVLTQEFDTERAVAVGFSVLPNLTEVGDRIIQIGNQPIMADTFVTHSTPVKFIQ